MKLSVVTVRTIGRWLRRHHRCPTFPSYRCDLMGCLYADGGHGFLFLCGADEPKEQRFTVAHDTAHFLVDYWLPRQRILAALGPDIAEVLDGRRPPQPQERVAAVLERVRLGPYWHLLPRGAQLREDDPIAAVEDRADELGLELVAPRRRVLQSLRDMDGSKAIDAKSLRDTLGSFFGLPPYVFTNVVAEAQRPRVPSFLEDMRRALGR